MVHVLWFGVADRPSLQLCLLPDAAAANAANAAANAVADVASAAAAQQPLSLEGSYELR